MVKGGWKRPKDETRERIDAANDEYAAVIARRYEALLAAGREDAADELFDLPAPGGLNG